MASWKLLLFFLLLHVSIGATTATTDDWPPLAILPIPSWRQLRFHSRPLSMFFHFGMNTFTDLERGSGHEDPSIFNPTALNASQWMLVAKAAGAELVILTAKHHDGFCLWPSAYTNFSVASSPWKNGTGDVVAEFVSAAREQGLDVGIYLSPWDLHESCYGDTLLYNEFYLAQLRELLTGYGPISEVWLDGAKSENATDMNYMFQLWFDTIHQLQPDANIFSDAGPDIRWVGDEYGEAGESCWLMVNKSSIVIGKSDARYLMSGEANGTDWVPPECDISIRPGWFWHKDESPKTLEQLLDVYYKSSGRNCLLLLNVPPNSSGLIQDDDIQVLKRFRSALESTFSLNLAANASVTASSTRNNKDMFQPRQILSPDMSTYWSPRKGDSPAWLQLDLEEAITFNLVEIREPISMGQRVKQHRAEVWTGKSWDVLINSTTIGYRKVVHVETTVAHSLRLVIQDSRADPLISYLGLFIDQHATTLQQVNGSSGGTSSM